MDEKTRFHKCRIDRQTNFEDVDLDLCRVSPDLRTSITHNLRESRWREWYGKRHWFYKWPVWLFWQLSDYGRSVHRIVIWFVVLSAVFAAVYFTAAVAWPPGIINNFLADENGCVGSPAMGMLRAFYFSIVTMTTLGFGDMHARVNEPWGHVLLMLQVVAGYFLLGVLVSRVTIAFQTVGPAQPLAKPPLRGRLVTSVIAGAVCLALAVGGWAWYGWAESRWPKVHGPACAEEQRRWPADMSSSNICPRGRETMTVKKYTEILARGRPLTEQGIHGVALTKRDALEAVEVLKKAGVPILGGDVWQMVDGKLQLEYSNWYMDRMDGESEASYAARSIAATVAYLHKFPDAEDGTIFYVLVPQDRWPGE